MDYNNNKDDNNNVAKILTFQTASYLFSDFIDSGINFHEWS